MHKDMTHIDYIAPWSLRMTISKFRSEHVCGLSDNFHIFDNRKIQHRIQQKIICCFIRKELIDIAY